MDASQSNRLGHLPKHTQKQGCCRQQLMRWLCPATASTPPTRLALLPDTHAVSVFLTGFVQYNVEVNYFATSTITAAAHSEIVYTFSGTIAAETTFFNTVQAFGESSAVGQGVSSPPPPHLAFHTMIDIFLVITQISGVEGCDEKTCKHCKHSCFCDNERTIHLHRKWCKVQ